MLNLDSCFVIAEAATCHADKSDDKYLRFCRAVEYIQAAKKCGADAIKFQMFHDPNPETMFCWIKGDEDLCQRWHQSVMEYDQWEKIKDVAEQHSIAFLASAFEYETVKWLTELQVEATKVASRAAGNLEHFKDAPKPLLVSNGMHFVKKAKDIIILQCEANYPSTKRWTDVYPGFSDHSSSPWLAIDAIARGCKLIEVHFYIKKSHAGPNLPASLTLDELKLVCEARNAFGGFIDESN